MVTVAENTAHVPKLAALGGAAVACVTMARGMRMRVIRDGVVGLAGAKDALRLGVERASARGVDGLPLPAPREHTLVHVVMVVVEIAGADRMGRNAKLVADQRLKNDIAVARHVAIHEETSPHEQTLVHAAMRGSLRVVGLRAKGSTALRK